MKRVVIVRATEVEPDSRVEKEANILAKSGYNVTILAWNRSSDLKIRTDMKELQETTVKRISFGGKAEYGASIKSIKPYLFFQYRVCKWLICNRDSYDIVHLCDFHTGFFGSIPCRLFRKKFIYDIFDYMGTNPKTIKHKIIKNAEDNIIRYANATIICTEERKEQIKGTHPKNLVVIHNTPPNDYLLESYTELSSNRRIKVGYVGILQDYRLLVEMVKEIERMRDVELHIGGFGKYEKFMKSESEKYDNIFFYGKLSYKETLNLENSCDIMTAIYDPKCSDHKYAAPNKFYESLMLGKPLIMVKGTGMSNVIETEEIGEVIEYTGESFTEGLRKIISRRDKWPEISDRMKNLYTERYSLHTMEIRLLNLYKKLLSI